MIAAARLPLRNDPAKSQFLRPRAHGRIWFSAQLPCGAVTNQAAFVDGRRHIIALLLLLGLPVLLNAKAMYDGKGAPCEALGT